MQPPYGQPPPNQAPQPPTAPGPQPGFGPPGVPPGQQGPPEGVKPPSGVALAVWLVGGFLGTIIGAVLVGIAAAGSESAGVTASYIVAGPVGFGWGGALGALIGYLAFQQKPTHRKIAPVGCGCGCALFAAVGLVVFMTAIFPAL